MIYDTSYLMKNQRLLTREWLTDIEKIRLREKGCIVGQPGTPDSYDTAEVSPVCVQFDVYVPLEVSEELAGHFDQDPAPQSEQDKAARSGRKRLVQLVSQSGCREPRLSELELPEVVFESPLGADSPVDRNLIRLAVMLARNEKYRLVILATDDGGIMYDVAKLHRQQREPLCCISRPDDPEEGRQLYTLLEVVYQEQRARYHSVRELNRGNSTAGGCGSEVAHMLRLLLVVTVVVLGIRWIVFTVVGWYAASQ